MEIFIHRLLKNSIKSNEYWLFTKQFSKYIESNSDYQTDEIKETVLNFGILNLDIINFTKTINIDRKESLLSKFINFPKMLKYYN